jgi:hypothetical protein
MAEGHPSVPSPPAPPWAQAPAPAPPPPSRSRRGLWIALTAVGVVLVLLLAGSVIAVVTLLGRPATDDRGSDEIATLLADHTGALAKRDLQAFLAPFDPADKDLVARQTTLFHSLDKLPLAEARYEEFGATVSTEGTFDVQVSFVHRFDGADPIPVEELYEWTVTRTSPDAALKVTAVKGGLPVDKGRDQTTYYPAPWDRGRSIHVEKTPHTVVIADESLKAEARRYAPLAERAATENLAAWRAGGVDAKVPQGFVISLVKGKKELGSLYRTTKETPIESGVAIPVQPVGAIDGTAQQDVATTRVVIDVADKRQFMEGNGRRLEIFRHELAHAIVAVLTERGPAATAFDGPENWVVEGFAEYFAHDRKPFTTSDRTAEAREILRTYDYYQRDLPNNVAWKAEGRLSYHYWLGHSAMSYLADRYGEKKLCQFVAEHYRGKPIGKATRDVFGVSFEAFEADWSAHLRSVMS